MRTVTIICVNSLLCCIFCGCLYSSCKKIDIKKVDLSKLSFYDGLKFLVFKSETGKIDTLKLKKNDMSYTPCNKFELSKNQYQIKYISFTNSANHGDFYSDISFELNNEFREDSSAIFYLRVHCVWDVYENHDGIDTIRNDFLNKKLLCKKFNWDGSVGSGKENEIRNFHWNDSFGLIRYTTQGGEVYDLIKKCY